MSDPPARRAPPGWYSDQGRSGYRYWDGESWVEPMGSPVRVQGAGSGGRLSLGHQRAGLAFMGAAVAMLIAGLLLPWADGGSNKQGVIDGDLPWLLGPGGIADTWLLILLVALLVWALLVVALAGDSARMWLTALSAGLLVMAFCVVEGLALDNDLDLLGAEVGLGLFVAYAGGAAAAIGGVLLKPSR
ncbi:MAG: DUF2510 domain-containing protein [Acidimicrobiia bacterium]|nr:DUF2510 domain-containing protein [Acidimicrobiia bacterium]